MPTVSRSGRRYRQAWEADGIPCALRAVRWREMDYSSAGCRGDGMKGGCATEFQPFSQKQYAALTWWCRSSPYKDYDAIICDGAVRSGKTFCLSLSFVAWAFSAFEQGSFALCGKTLASLRRNLVRPLCALLRELGVECAVRESTHEVRMRQGGRELIFYLFGGRDESSAALIQGMTLSGVLFDEVALMPRSFVEQALARCSVEGSKFWFNCNPEHPRHWFYTEWIQKKEAKKALYLHFTMQDNPSLSPSIRQRYESLYSGAFYERFVLGKWVAAEGLVYPMFSEKRHVSEPPASPPERVVISCDYGTSNPASFGLWGLWEGVWYRMREYYYDSRRQGVQKTDEEYYRALEALADGMPVEMVICDPSAASFLACIRRHGRFSAVAGRNEVRDGIRRVATALGEGQIRIAPCCEDTLREFSLYRWEEGSDDRPRKENDHAMDDIRYFVSTLLDGGEEAFAAVAMSRGGDGQWG